MRRQLFVLLLLLGVAGAAPAQVSIGIGLPGVNIGINLPVYPDLVAVPGYPVYYAPNLNSNYFFYDGMYWVYQGDEWYASSWYNGPWGRVGPEAVPLFVLRIPVGYYRQPPSYFRGWQRDAPPRWGEHWGRDWQQRRSGWDQWDRRAVRAPAPLPAYQRQYSGNRYPRVEQQRELHDRNYRYDPKDQAVRDRYQQERAAPAAAARGPQSESRPGTRQESPRSQETQRAQPSEQQRESPRAEPQGQGQERARESNRGGGQGQERGPQGARESNRGAEQGQDRNREKGERGEKGDDRRQERGR
jgi:hypothetical protein